MKLKFFLLIMIFFQGFLSQAQCFNCNENSTQFTRTGELTYSSQTAQAYFWEICNGNATIVGSNTAQNIQVSNNAGGQYTVRLTRFVSGNCVISCLTITDPITVPSLPNIYCFGFDPVTPVDVSSLGKLNKGFLNSYGQAPFNIPGVIYHWKFKFKNGQIQDLYGQNPTFRELCPTNPVVSFGVIISNGVSETREYSGPLSGPYSMPEFSRETPDCSFHRPCDPFLDLGDDDGGFSVDLIKKAVNSNVVYIESDKRLQFLDFEIKLQYEFILYDLSGKVLINEILENNTIDIQFLNSGMYVYHLKNKNGETSSGKLLVP